MVRSMIDAEASGSFLSGRRGRGMRYDMSRRLQVRLCWKVFALCAEACDLETRHIPRRWKAKDDGCRDLAVHLCERGDINFVMLSTRVRVDPQKCIWNDSRQRHLHDVVRTEE